MKAQRSAIDSDGHRVVQKALLATVLFGPTLFVASVVMVMILLGPLGSRWLFDADGPHPVLFLAAGPLLPVTFWVACARVVHVSGWRIVFCKILLVVVMVAGALLADAILAIIVLREVVAISTIGLLAGSAGILVLCRRLFRAGRLSLAELLLGMAAIGLVALGFGPREQANEKARLRCERLARERLGDDFEAAAMRERDPLADDLDKLRWDWDRDGEAARRLARILRDRRPGWPRTMARLCLATSEHPVDGERIGRLEEMGTAGVFWDSGRSDLCGNCDPLFSNTWFRYTAIEAERLRAALAFNRRLNDTVETERERILADCEAAGLLD